MRDQWRGVAADRSTPVYHVSRTSEGARARVRSTIDGVEADSSTCSTGGYHSVARLRSDQEWMRARLEERGIVCIQTDPDGAARHVSDEMIRAGMQALRDCFRSSPMHLTDVSQSRIVERIYAAMESAR